jgi:hypothetical protein
MRRLIASLSALCMLGAIGCTHTAGICDCYPWAYGCGGCCGNIGGSPTSYGCCGVPGTGYPGAVTLAVAVAPAAPASIPEAAPPEIIGLPRTTKEKDVPVKPDGPGF